MPCGPINTLDQVFADPQVAARGMKLDLPHPLAGTVPQVGNPLQFSATPIAYDRAPPLLGEHTAAVLRERLAHAGGRSRRAGGARGDPGEGVNAGATARALTRHAGVLGRVRGARGRRARRRLAPVPARHSARQPRRQARARARRSPAPKRSTRSWHLAPAGARAAARFANDQAIQNYVELEGGGKAAFAALVAGSVYAPYWWEVRLFKPGEVTEAVIRFRPDGTPYGFRAAVAGNLRPGGPGAPRARPRGGARLAEERASADWGVDFAPYVLLESAQQTRTTGRVDHSFVYERTARGRSATRISGCGSRSPATR